MKKIARNILMGLMIVTISCISVAAAASTQSIVQLEEQAIDTIFRIDDMLFACTEDEILGYDAGGQTLLTMLKTSNQHFHVVPSADGACMLLDTETCTLYHVIYDEGTDSISLEKQQTLKQQAFDSKDWEGNATYFKAVIQGNTLLLLLQDFDMLGNPITWLTVYNLVSNEFRELSVSNILDICPKDGTTVLAVQKNDGLELVSLDIDAEKTTPIIQLPGTNQMGLTYAMAEKTVYLLCDGQLVSIKNGKMSESLAYVPVQFQSLSDVAVFISPNYYLLNDGSIQTINVQQASAMERETLSISGFSAEGFQKAHPEIEVKIVEQRLMFGDDIAKVMITGSDAVDVFCLPTSFGLFSLVKEKQYAVDLSVSSFLKSEIDKMYPFMADAVEMDGKMYGFPSSVSLYTTCYSAEMLAQLGMDESQLPTTLSELISFLASWDREELAIDTGYPSSLKRFLFLKIMNTYADTLSQNGQHISFDTPLLRGLLQQIDEAAPALAELDKQYGEVWEATLVNEAEINCLLSDQSINLLPGCRFDLDWQPLMLSLDQQYPPMLDMSASVYVVNPYSPKKELAIALVEYEGEHMDEAMKIALYPNYNEPLQWPDYQEHMATLQAELDQAKVSLAEAKDEDKKTWQEQIDELESSKDNLNQRRWDISPEAINAYREIAPSIKVGEASNLWLLTADQCSSSLDQYYEGRISSTQLLKELDRVAQMIQLEAGN